MPATQNYVLSKGKKAGSALTKKRFVKFSAEETVVPCSSAGEACYGVAQFSVSAAEILKGKLASVVVEGRAIVEAGAAINAGQAVATDANGKAQVATSGQVILGYCDEPAAGDTNECSIVLSIAGGKA